MCLSAISLLQLLSFLSLFPCHSPIDYRLKVLRSIRWHFIFVNIDLKCSFSLLVILTSFIVLVKDFSCTYMWQIAFRQAIQFLVHLYSKDLVYYMNQGLLHWLVLVCTNRTMLYRYQTSTWYGGVLIL